MLEYLRFLCHLVKADPWQFVDRLETLLHYTFYLPGTATAIIDDEKKWMIFKAFLDNWKKQYIWSGKDLVTDTLDHGMV